MTFTIDSNITQNFDLEDVILQECQELNPETSLIDLIADTDFVGMTQEQAPRNWTLMDKDEFLVEIRKFPFWEEYLICFQYSDVDFYLPVYFIVSWDGVEGLNAIAIHDDDTEVYTDERVIKQLEQIAFDTFFREVLP